MREKILKKKTRCWFFAVVVAVSGVCLLDTVTSLQALRVQARYDRLRSKTLGYERPEDYYILHLSYLSDLIRLQPLCANYAAAKGDTLNQAFDKGFGRSLGISRKDVAEGYWKAIALNPLYYGYHLKLGWFFAEGNNLAAEQELQKAQALYPANYFPYLYLMKYYFRRGDEEKAFRNLLMTVYFQEAPNKKALFRNALDLAAGDMHDLSQLTIDRRGGLIEYTVLAKAPSFSLGGEKFPHIAEDLSVRIFIATEGIDVLLCQDKSECESVACIGNEEGYAVYETVIDPAKKNAFLDEFSIKTKPWADIDKIIFTKQY